MDIVNSIAVASGLAWASGLRLYAVLFLAGLLGRLGYVSLPEGLAVLQHAAVIGAAGLMFLVEFFADKIPALDSVWDGIHTFVRGGPANQDIRLSEISASMGDGNRLPRSRSNEKTSP